MKTILIISLTCLILSLFVSPGKDTLASHVDESLMIPTIEILSDSAPN
jgi:hypothetical protein